MRPLRLMADYDCHPLWEPGADPYNVAPSSLGIPAELATALQDWADQYTATLDRWDPTASGFADESVAEAWLRRGAHFASRMRDEGYAVTYLHQGTRGRDLVAGT